MCVFRERLSIFMCASFPFGFEGGMWGLIVLVPDHCLSLYFSSISSWNEISPELEILIRFKF